MLQFYLTTVVIWLIILYALAFLSKDAIRKNGWLDDAKKPKYKFQGFLTAVALSAVPILRLIAAFTILVMAYNTKETVYALVKEKREQEND